MGFLRAPYTHPLRRALFQVHLWTGIAVGLYLLLMSVTGAALLFRINLQRALNPELFVSPTTGPLAPIETVLANLAVAYPEHRIAGVDAPTVRRPGYLAYVAKGSNFTPVLIDASDGRVLGALPQNTLATTLQQLHFDLLSGRTGRTVNGIGAMLLAALVLTGAVIWWQGTARWRRGLMVDLTRPPRRINWELHGAAGFWTHAMLLMWAITGLYFAFPRSFVRAVDAMSPITAQVSPRVTARPNALPAGELLGRARALKPGLHVARVIPPDGPEATFQVHFAHRSPTPIKVTLDAVHLDPYSGEPVPVAKESPSIGDRVLEWAGPLHTGAFGGWPVRLAWLVLALAPALLFATGFISWYSRVISPVNSTSPAEPSINTRRQREWTSGKI